MSTLEQLANIKLFRDERGEYHAYVDFDVHGESPGKSFATIEGVMVAIGDIVRSDLRARKTIEIAPVPMRPGDGA